MASSMAAVSELKEEEKSNAPAVLALSAVPVPVPWLAAVAERYERREKLGEGMFGDVYKAWDRVQGRFVAVKRLPGRTDDRFVATPLPDLERQVTSLAACRGHPSVVQLLAVAYGDGGGDCFVVTEYAGPRNLRQYMEARRRNGQPFDEDEVRDVMQQLLGGARHAHAAGVLHRDIVPENVVVDMDAASGRMVYKICGFGTSKPAAEADEDGSGMLASASPFRAPELFLGSKDYDGRVDTWSLGCIMAELVAGNGAPFFGAPDGEVFIKMLKAVGTAGIIEWQGLERVAPAETVALLREMVIEEGGHLRRLQEGFPPEVLSPAGFEVLAGLLDSNPDRRLSAAAALRKQWFEVLEGPLDSKPEDRRRRRLSAAAALRKQWFRRRRRRAAACSVPGASSCQKTFFYC